MELRKKLAAIEEIYGVYGEFSGRLNTACRKGCAHCCTGKVLMTTLEGFRIAEYIEGAGRQDLYARVRNRMHAGRFVPRITTNGLAEACIRGAEVPAEPVESSPGTCPLLHNKECLIYPVRPFGCRCLVSRIDCGTTGYADMDDYTVSVNTVFLQYVEHVDAGGCSGNFADVLLAFESRAMRAFYREGALSCTECDMIENRPIPALMIPPQHRQRIRPLLESLSSKIAFSKGGPSPPGR